MERYRRALQEARVASLRLAEIAGELATDAMSDGRYLAAQGFFKTAATASTNANNYEKALDNFSENGPLDGQAEIAFGALRDSVRGGIESITVSSGDQSVMLGRNGHADD